MSKKIMAVRFPLLLACIGLCVLGNGSSITNALPNAVPPAYVEFNDMPGDTMVMTNEEAYITSVVQDLTEMVRTNVTDVVDLSNNVLTVKGTSLDLNITESTNFSTSAKELSFGYDSPQKFAASELATTESAGLMSKSDKQTIDALPNLYVAKTNGIVIGTLNIKDSMTAETGQISYTNDQFVITDHLGDIIKFPRYGGGEVLLQEKDPTVGLTNATLYVHGQQTNIVVRYANGAVDIGIRTNSLVGIYSIASGTNTMASGSYSSAKGLSTGATNAIANAEGAYSVAGGIGAHAEGTWVEAIGDFSHAEGYRTRALGYASHAEGLLTEAGYYTNDEETVSFAHAEGVQTKATALSSHTEGSQTEASITAVAAHAEGVLTLVEAPGAHAEGLGYEFAVPPWGAFKFGRASGFFSHSEGLLSSAFGLGSHVGGFFAFDTTDLSSPTNSMGAYVWQGYSGPEASNEELGFYFSNPTSQEAKVFFNSVLSNATIYEGHGKGTFNINPAGGLSGFYIGDTNLYTILTTKVDNSKLSEYMPLQGDSAKDGNLSVLGNVNISSGQLIVRSMGGVVLGTIGTDHSEICNVGIRTFGHNAPLLFPDYNDYDYFGRLQDIAETFDDTRTSANKYKQDEMTAYNGKLYRCTNSSGHYGAWDSNNFETTTVAKVMNTRVSTNSLAGKVYNTADPVDFTNAVWDIVRVLGGSITNFPVSNP